MDEPLKGRFIDPLSDFGFKFYFSEQNKALLIDFLNALFEGKKKIIDLVYLPTEQIGDTDEHKKVFFDLMCRDDQGEDFIVEMQRASQFFFRDRSVFYVSRAINRQLPAGAPSWDYNLTGVYMIGLLEFKLEETPVVPGRYIRDIFLTDRETGEIFYNKLQYKFIEPRRALSGH